MQTRLAEAAAQAGLLVRLAESALEAELKLSQAQVPEELMHAAHPSVPGLAEAGHPWMGLAAAGLGLLTGG